MQALAAVAVTLLFTCFDLWQFPRSEGWRVLYRILQATVQVGLYALAWWLTGWQAAVAAAVVWFTGGCDVLYYWLGGYAWYDGPWYWLWWTPAGLVQFLPRLVAGSSYAAARERVAISGRGVLMQAGAGVVAAMVGLFTL